MAFRNDYTPPRRRRSRLSGALKYVCVGVTKTAKTMKLVDARADQGRSGWWHGSVRVSFNERADEPHRCPEEASLLLLLLGLMLDHAWRGDGRRGGRGRQTERNRGREGGSMMGEFTTRPSTDGMDGRRTTPAAAAAAAGRTRTWSVCDCDTGGARARR